MFDLPYCVFYLFSKSEAVYIQLKGEYWVSAMLYVIYNRGEEDPVVHPHSLTRSLRSERVLLWLFRVDHTKHHTSLQHHYHYAYYYSYYYYY